MVIAIIQARMGATRLPGKVMKRVLRKTLLAHLVERISRAQTIDKIVVATTTHCADAIIVREAKRLGVGVFRGSEHDVLDRYYQAAKVFKAQDKDAIVRLTADCPLMDPSVVDRVVRCYLRNKKKYHYVSNVRPPTYPDGMDVEIFSFFTLRTMWKNAKLKSEREHVTPYIAKHKKQFRVGNVRYKKDFSTLRLTVDTPEDLLVIKNIFTRLYSHNQRFILDDILRLWEKEPGLFYSNKHMMRNEGYQKSLLQDRNG